VNCIKQINLFYASYDALTSGAGDPAMNILSNNALQQIDEAGLHSPIGRLNSTVSQDAIDAGLRKARLLRARAFHQAVGRLVDLLKGRGGSTR
tara:strand:- start:799 stop:1077 length:279 start_codon:yes stop_codon:yes gene_type:complete